MSPSLSIIVPVLNEAALIGNFLQCLQGLAPDAEIIVVDGGSADATPQIAASLVKQVITTNPGRALQMNAGAAISHGDVLWFLHADVALPTRAPQMISDLLRDPDQVGGWFRLRFPSPQLIYRVSDSLGNLGADIFGFALGDHGIFCRRAAFHRAGGYPLLPILEDAELCRRLARIGRMSQLQAEIRCSPRGYEQYGPYRTTAVYFLILVLYVLRVPITVLNRIYTAFRRNISPSKAEPQPGYGCPGETSPGVPGQRQSRDASLQL